MLLTDSTLSASFGGGDGIKTVRYLMINRLFIRSLIALIQSPQ
jgi:hypothetical protein